MPVGDDELRVNRPGQADGAAGHGRARRADRRMEAVVVGGHAHQCVRTMRRSRRTRPGVGASGLSTRAGLPASGDALEHGGAPLERAAHGDDVHARVGQRGIQVADIRQVERVGLALIERVLVSGRVGLVGDRDERKRRVRAQVRQVHRLLVRLAADAREAHQQDAETVASPASASTTSPVRSDSSPATAIATARRASAPVTAGAGLAAHRRDPARRLRGRSRPGRCRAAGWCHPRVKAMPCSPSHGSRRAPRVPCTNTSR